MNKRLLSRVYDQITPPTTRWLPRYYNTLKLVGDQAGGIILDGSCGTGDITIKLKREGAEIVGVNISKQEVVLAQGKQRKAGLQIDFVIGDLTKAPFKDQAFSQIISLDTLEHIADDRGVLQEFARILQPSGKLILSVPHGATNSAKLFREQRILRKLIPRFLYANASFRGKSWLEATTEDTMDAMGHLRDYSIDELKKKTASFFEITHYEYALKKFSSLATDITYGIKGFPLLKPFIFFIAVRLDRYFHKNAKGYSLIVEMVKKGISAYV